MKPLFDFIHPDGFTQANATLKYGRVSTNKKTERGELLKYFAQETEKNIKYIAFRLTGIPTQDLYYIKSVCDELMRRQDKEDYLHAFNSCLYVPKK